MEHVELAFGSRRHAGGAPQQHIGPWGAGDSHQDPFSRLEQTVLFVLAQVLEELLVRLVGQVTQRQLAQGYQVVGLEKVGQA